MIVRQNLPRVRKKKNNKLLYIMGLIIIGIILVSMLVNVFKKSLFFTNKDRINFVMYGKDTTYFSIGKKAVGNYAIPFFPDIKVQVPGGYGEYRVGALGKLVALEKKPQILQRTFSLATNSFVDYYFYPKTEEISFGQESSISIPSAKMIWSSYSNARFLDKVYFILYFLNKREQDFKKLLIEFKRNEIGERILAIDAYEKKFTGYLFQETYRNERKSVQIYYASEYVNAVRVGKLLEGNGIRVGDVSQEGSLVKGCAIHEDTASPSLTATALMNVFGCTWKRGNTDIYDILFKLGEKEKEWEIKS